MIGKLKKIFRRATPMFGLIPHPKGHPYYLPHQTTQARFDICRGHASSVWSWLFQQFFAGLVGPCYPCIEILWASVTRLHQAYSCSSPIEFIGGCLPLGFKGRDIIWEVYSRHPPLWPAPCPLSLTRDHNCWFTIQPSHWRGISDGSTPCSFTFCRADVD